MEVSLIEGSNNHQVDLEKNNQEKNASPEIVENRILFNNPTVGNVQCSVTATPKITLFHGSVNLNNSVLLQTMASPNSLNICLLLEGFIETHFQSHKKTLHLCPNSHNSIHLIEPEGEHQFPGGENKVFHLNIRSDHFFNHFNSDDVITDKFRNSIFKNLPLVASSKPMPVSPEMKSVIYALMNNPFRDGMKKMYLELKTFELLMMQFLQFDEKSDTGTSLSPKERKIASEIKMLLEDNYLQSWTLGELAKQTGTNIQTVKKSFKITYNTNVFTYYQKLRMDYAKHLLLDLNKTVAEVSDTLGYSHQNHFSLAFKKMFGYPPSQLKERQAKLFW